MPAVKSSRNMDESGKITAVTVGEIHKILRSCFRQAVKWGIMKKNPATDATVPKHKTEERKIWTAEMLMQAIEVCENKWLKIAFHLCFTATLKIGELLGLAELIWYNQFNGYICCQKGGAASMNGATTIQERLKDLRLNKGLKLEELAEQTGISKSALGSYEKDDYKEINHGNLILLADFYGVSLDYLFCRSENRTEINTPLRELHLSDEMVALLKSGRINNRLLCELATHKDFIKFLADIEIYVDGIATMQIQNLNALVDTVRHEIIERYRPGEDDPHLKVLQAAHISDDEYFSHMVRDDLNLIIRDIREAHKKDSESAPQTTVADELKENLEAVENFKGSRDEKLVVLYCKQLGINYKNLSDEEFRWLIRILKKSKKMGTPISQRKKR